jgi:hypothetical protein
MQARGLLVPLQPQLQRQLVLCIGQGLIPWLGLRVGLQALVAHPRFI